MSFDGNGRPFQARRAKFLQAVGEGATAILPSAPVALRSGDVEFIYRQDSDFYYLTGFEEPEAIALFSPGHPDGDFVMFVRPRDKERETWTGRRAGVEGAMIEYGAVKAYMTDEFEKIVPRYLEKSERIYYPIGRNEKLDERVLKLVQWSSAMRPRIGSGPYAIVDPREFLHEARLRKEPAELELMRHAAAISAEAHKAAMRKARGGMKEWQIEAEVNFAFRSRGASGPSYPSIVASGPNAAILHHIENRREMCEGELLLIDAGCEYEFYASDITRTFPVGGKFSGPQKAVYELVLAAQLACIDAVRPGRAFHDYHRVAERVLAQGMIDLGLCEGSLDAVMESEAYKQFYMHRAGHWLGLDVHDVGLYRVQGESPVLAPGMVLTVEPGCYIRPGEKVPEQFWDIGVRIEDDVLVTAQGNENLTAAVPKMVADVEAACAR